MAVGNLVVRLGHKPTPLGMVLFATTQVGDQSPQMWRQFEVPLASVPDMALQLAAEAEDYILSAGGPVRPTEDFDFDDFIEHATRTATGAMN